MSLVQGLENTSWRGPRTPESNVALVPGATYERWRRFFLGYFRIFHRVEFVGTENVPPTGPLIVAPNHVSYYDPVLVASGLEGRFRFMAWAALFQWRISNWWLRRFGAFPVSLESNDFHAYRKCLDLLELNERVMVFPEAGRNHAGELLPFKEGVGRMAIKAGGVPVVPVVITGAEKAWPRGEVGPRFWFPITVRFMPPVVPRPVSGAREVRAEANRVMTEVRASIERGLRESGEA